MKAIERELVKRDGHMAFSNESEDLEFEGVHKKTMSVEIPLPHVALPATRFSATRSSAGLASGGVNTDTLLAAMDAKMKEDDANNPKVHGRHDYGSVELLEEDDVFDASVVMPPIKPVAVDDSLESLI